MLLLRCAKIIKLWTVSWTGAGVLSHRPWLANKVDRPSLFRCRAFCDLGPVDPIISEGTVSQVINVTNAMQGTKTLMMKLKIQFQRGGVSVAEMAQVAQFPAGY